VDEHDLALYCAIKDMDKGLLHMLLVEARFQDLDTNEMCHYVMAAFEELEMMPEDEGLEWANARVDMHNQWGALVLAQEDES